MKLNILLFLPNEFNIETIPIIENFYQFVSIKEKDIIEGAKSKSYYEFVSEIQRETKAVSWLSIGDVNWSEYLHEFPFEYRKRWIHRKNFDNWNINEINFCYFISSYGHSSDNDNPLVSVITTTFNSGKEDQ